MHIFANQIICECNSKFPVNDLWTLRNSIAAFAQSILDVAGLSFAIGYTVEIKSVSYNGGALVFPITFPGVAKELKPGEMTELPVSVEILRRPLLVRACADIRSAILIPGDTGFFCYRAIESVGNQLIHDKYIKNKKESFDFFERELKIENRYYNFLKVVGGEARHGKIISISGEERKHSVQISRATIMRIAEWYGGVKANWENSILPEISL